MVYKRIQFPGTPPAQRQSCHLATLLAVLETQCLPVCSAAVRNRLTATSACHPSVFPGSPGGKEDSLGAPPTAQTPVQAKIIPEGIMSSLKQSVFILDLYIISYLLSTLSLKWSVLPSHSLFLTITEIWECTFLLQFPRDYLFLNIL